MWRRENVRTRQHGDIQQDVGPCDASLLRDGKHTAVVQEVEMVRRSVAGTDAQSVPDGVRDVAFRPCNRFSNRMAACQVGGNCRGIRASGAVCVFRVDVRRRKCVELLPVI